MLDKFKVVIPKPCHENWQQMTPDEQGRFCGVCVRSVIDFTEMNDAQVKTFFYENAGKKICGRFRNEQVDDGLIFKIPKSVIYKKRKFRKAFLLALFVVMGTTLFSCKNASGRTIGEVAIEQESTAFTVEQDSISKDSSKLVRPAIVSEEVLPPPKVSDIKIKEKEESGVITMGMPIVEPSIVKDDSTKVK